MPTKTYMDAYGIPAPLVGILKGMRDPLPLRYTRHAMLEAVNDRYGTIASRHFPTVFILAHNWTLVEVTAVGDVPVKFVVRRGPVDDTRSLVLVIGHDGTVRTLWTNLNTDNHATLNKSKFDKPGAS